MPPATAEDACTDPSCRTCESTSFLPPNMTSLSPTPHRSFPRSNSCKKKNYHTINYHAKDIPLSVQAGMNETNNVLMQYTLSDLAQRADTNFWLGLLCLGVCAINIALLTLNYLMDPAMDFSARPQIAHRTFHLIEFWVSHVYAIAEACALIASPRTMEAITNQPTLLKLLLFFNVVNSMVPALLITVDTHYFERIAHNFEYVNEFSLSFITLILLVSLLKPQQQLDSNDAATITSSTFPGHDDTSPTITAEQNGFGEDPELARLLPSSTTSPTIQKRRKETDTDYSADMGSIAMGCLACALAVTNLLVYHLYREALAHYLEFMFNIVTSLITFWFCLENRFVAQLEIGQILYGNHENCAFCQERATSLTIMSSLSQQQQASATQSPEAVR